MRAALRNGTVVSILPGGAIVRLPGGAIVRSRPQPNAAYRETALSLGYGSDTLAMARDHDPLHAALCDWLGLDDSPALRVAAGIDADNDLARCEEAAVIAVQRFFRQAGGKSR